MRKLGIVTAVAGLLLAVFGFSGTASAQGSLPEDVCTPFDEVAAGAAEQGEANDPDGGGEPFTSTFDGASKSCHESVKNDKVNAGPLLCGVRDGLNVRPGEGAGDEFDQIRQGLAESGLNDATPIGPNFEGCGEGDPECENCPSTTTTTPGGGGGEPDPEVLGSNQTADGGLPRTGGELFAGLGFGLAGIGALARRFLPIS